jgi:hypothetical protein
VSAFRRLTLYEGAYGFTWLRILVHATILALGMLLLCAVVGLIRGRGAWLPAAAVVIASASVIGLNLLNLDAFIAERNLARTAAGATLDVQALTALSADAVPSTVAALPQLTSSERHSVEASLACTRDQLDRQASAGWAGTNHARDSAIEILGELWLPRCGSDARAGRD